MFGDRGCSGGNRVSASRRDDGGGDYEYVWGGGAEASKRGGADASVDSRIVQRRRKVDRGNRASLTFEAFDICRSSSNTKSRIARAIPLRFRQLLALPIESCRSPNIFQVVPWKLQVQNCCPVVARHDPTPSESKYQPSRTWRVRVSWNRR